MSGPTQNVALTMQIRFAGITCGSGGSEHGIFLAYAYAPGKILGLAPMSPPPGNIPGDFAPYGGPWVPENPGKPVYFSDVTGLHELKIGDGTCIQRAAALFNINTNQNPYWQDNFVLCSLGKNGGSPSVTAWFNVVCETTPFERQTIDLQHPLP